MNDNQKQIKEMTKIVDKVFRCYYKGDYESGIKDFATHLVEFGAIVLPEGSVVSSKREYEKLNIKIDCLRETITWYDNDMKKEIDQREKKIDQARKETAEKILNEVKDMFINTNYNIDWIVNKLEEIANREGVEIKE